MSKQELWIPRHSLIRGDGHVHSTLSDGVLLPDQAVILAAQRGLHWISITDHELPLFRGAYDRAMNALVKSKYAHKLALFKGAELGVKFCGVLGHGLIMVDDEISPEEFERDVIRMQRMDDPKADLPYVLQWVRERKGIFTYAHAGKTGLPGASLLGFPLQLIAQAQRVVGPGESENGFDEGMEVFSRTEMVTYPELLRPLSGKLWQFATEIGLAKVAYSDTHIPATLGETYTTVIAPEDITVSNQLFTVIRQAYLDKTTSMHNKRLHGKIIETNLARALIVINELVKKSRTKPDRRAYPWDPYHSARAFLRFSGQMSDEEYAIAERLLLEQEASRQAIFAELKYK